MLKEIHWFDLDHTLWATDAKWWILDKKNPEKPLFKINQYDGQLIINGTHIKDNNQIYYNGVVGWLSNEMITKIKQKKDINIEDIGVTFREYTSSELIQKQSENMFIYIDRLNDIKAKTINILTARANKEAHKEMIDILDKKLNEIGIKINESIFVNDSQAKLLVGTTRERKLQVLIQSLIGYEIKNNAFSSIMCESCDVCYFYDDEDTNIEECKFINERIRLLLSKTQPWLRQRIEENIKFGEKKMILNLVSSNEMNPFETEIVEVKV